MLQWNLYAPGVAGALKVMVLPGSSVRSNPPAVVSAVTVCCTAVLFLTVTVAPALTGDVANRKPLPPFSIVIAGPPAVGTGAVVELGAEAFTEALTGARQASPCRLEPYGVQVLIRKEK